MKEIVDSKDSPELLFEAGRIRDEALARFEMRAFEKYNAGQQEHGGLITARVTLEDLEDEIIDLWYYLQAFKEKLRKASDATNR